MTNIPDEVVRRVRLAIYEEMEGPVNNQDAGRQKRQYELADRLARAAIEAYLSSTGDIPVYRMHDATDDVLGGKG